MSDKDQDAFKASGTSPTYRLVARVVSIGRSAAGAVLERSRATVAARRRFTEVSSDCEDTAHAEPVKGLNRRAFLKSAGMTAVAGAVGTGTTSTQPELFRDAEREVEQDPIDSRDDDLVEEPDQLSSEPCSACDQAREDAWCERLFNTANLLDGDQAAHYRTGAERGDPKAQFELARLHKAGVGVPLDRVTAYKWLELAATQQTDEAVRRGASTVRRFAAMEMTPAEIADAQHLARAWAAAHPFERGPMILAAPPRPREPYALSSSVGG